MRTTLYEWCAENRGEALLREWDSEKNGALTPQTISYGSKKRPFWRCGNGHSWQAAVYSRTKGAGCPYCAGQRVWSGGNDLASCYPLLAEEWHPTLNGNLTPGEVLPGSHRKAWWRCASGHEWQAEVNSRTEGCGCPVCANRIALAGYNDLASLYPALAAEWHPAKNNGLEPSEVVAGSDRRVWWRCGKNSGHEWRAAVSSRVGGSGCPYCAGKRVQSGENDLLSAYPEIAAEWDRERNGALLPEDFLPQSNRKAWWRCPLGHSYAAAISGRTAGNRGCPYCAGRRVLPGFNDLATKEPKVAAQWYQPLNGNLTPQMVTYGSSKKVFWRCAEGHVWQAVIGSRAGKHKYGCPVCAGRRKVNFAGRYREIVDRARFEGRVAPEGQPRVLEAAK